jgi:hypothetical protein
MVRLLLQSWREQELSLERRFSTPGKIKRCCEKYALAPTKARAKLSRVRRETFIADKLHISLYFFY